MMELRLRGIFQEVDFRYNELTIYEKQRRLGGTWKGDPAPGETYLFVSRSGSQLLWVLHYEAETQVQKSKRRRIETLKFRVSGGYWNPLMLADYADAVGIKLVGIKKFEETFKQRRL